FCFAKIAWQFCSLYPRRMLFSRRILEMHTGLVAGMIGAFVVSSAVVGAEQQWQHFEVPAKDVAKAEELANQLAALSRRVDPKEATLVAQCAFSTVARLRHEYRMFGTPLFNNFLLLHGLGKRRDS